MTEATASSEQIQHPDGRSSSPTSPPIASSPYGNEELAPTRLTERQLDDVQLRGAVDGDGAQHPELPAGLRAGGARDELAAGVPDDHARRT